MRSLALLYGAVILLNACTSPGRDDTASPDRQSPASPAAAEAEDELTVVRDRIRATSGAISTGTTPTRLFARVSGEDQLLQVSDSAAWPADTDVSYRAVLDQEGRVLAWIETPVSETGDWFNEIIHYFGSDGSTIAVEVKSSFFNGCPQPAREHTLTFYAAGAEVVAREYTLTDLDGGAIDSERCDFHYRHPYQTFSSWDEVAAAYSIRL